MGFFLISLVKTNISTTNYSYIRRCNDDKFEYLICVPISCVHSVHIKNLNVKTYIAFFVHRFDGQPNKSNNFLCKERPYVSLSSLGLKLCVQKRFKSHLAIEISTRITLYVKGVLLNTCLYLYIRLYVHILTNVKDASFAT